MILAKAGISTVPDHSDITGSIAVSPIAGTAMTGFSETNPDGKAATSTQVSGFLYCASYLAPSTPGILTERLNYDQKSGFAYGIVSPPSSYNIQVVLVGSYDDAGIESRLQK